MFSDAVISAVPWLFVAAFCNGFCRFHWKRMSYMMCGLVHQIALQAVRQFLSHAGLYSIGDTNATLQATGTFLLQGGCGTDGISVDHWQRYG